MTLSPSRAARTVAGLVLLGTVAAACGSDDSADSGSAATDTPAAADAAATTASPGNDTPDATDGPAIETAETDLGTILVDADGRTLYMFAPDAQGPSTCEGDCIASWPAMAGPANAGEGVDESLLGTAARADDGSEQVTYGGWPLYYFAQDAAAGDVNGQGVNDVWYVIDPSGTPIGTSTGITSREGY
jgi:predicted lipoprotein with Yx(FWY)xxD motif